MTCSGAGDTHKRHNSDMYSGTFYTVHEKSKEEIMTVYVTEGTTKIGWALKHPNLGKIDEIMHAD